MMTDFTSSQYKASVCERWWIIVEKRGKYVFPDLATTVWTWPGRDREAERVFLPKCGVVYVIE